MRIDIDIEQSIKSGRIKTTKLNSYQLLDRFFFWFISLVIIGCTLTLLINAATKPVEKAFYFLLSTSPFSLFGIICFFNLYLDNKLVRIKGVNQEYNRHRIQTLLERGFSRMAQGSSNKIVRLYKPATCFKFGIRVIVLFDQEDMLVNISRFNQKGVKSIYHSVFDYLRLQNMRQEFS